MAYDYNRHLENRETRRLRNEPAQVAKIDREIDAAAALIGELVRDGKKVFYVNQLRKDGTPNGRTREFTYKHQAHEFLVRNRYI